MANRRYIGKRRRKDSANFWRNISIVSAIVVILSVIIHLTMAATVTTDEERLDVKASLPAEIVETTMSNLYDPDVDYLRVMIRAAVGGDDELLTACNIARNAKIWAERLDFEPLTVDEFLADFESYAGFDMRTDYISTMVECCLSGDVEGGRDAASRRNLNLEVLEEIGYDSPFHTNWGSPVDFDELLELSKIITAECGASWLPYRWKMAVGEVVLNRVESPEFPDTIYEVVHQKGQYARANSDWYANLTPIEDCVWAAFDLLQGVRTLKDPSVVFQAGGKQGSGVHTALYDEIFGYTYLCYSSYPELYKE